MGSGSSCTQLRMGPQYMSTVRYCSNNLDDNSVIDDCKKQWTAERLTGSDPQ